MIMARLSYQVFIHTRALDSEPELMGTAETVSDAWERVRVDIRAAHDSVPLECPKLESYARFPSYAAYQAAAASPEGPPTFVCFDQPDTLAPGETVFAAIADGCSYSVCCESPGD